MSESIPTSPQSLSLLKAKTVSGRWARRVFLAILLLLLVISAATRLRTYFMTRKIEAVLHGLNKIRLDETTEEQMTKMVPYLSEKDWKGHGLSYRSYYVHISNESDGAPWPYVVWSRKSSWSLP